LFVSVYFTLIGVRISDLKTCFSGFGHFTITREMHLKLWREKMFSKKYH
jgi:hypothetical protein